MSLNFEVLVKLDSVVKKLYDSISYFDVPKIDIKEINRRMAEAANEYRNLLKDLKYLEAMKNVRIR